MEVIRIIEGLAKEQDIKHVNEIVLEIGELSSVVPMFMDEYFPIVVNDKPLFDKCKLNFITIPGNAICDDCHTTFNIIENEGYCPKCHSFDKTLISGKEFSIREILVDDCVPAESNKV